jgi:hypothetical protein
MSEDKVDLEIIYPTLSGNRTPIMMCESIALSHCNFSTHALETDYCLPNITVLDFASWLAWSSFHKVICFRRLGRTRLS